MASSRTGPQRAYAQLHIKALDEEQRLIFGTATTPTPDLMGDIIDPEGAEFKLPLPFLWQHDSKQPIGDVTKATVTADGIDVVIQVAKITEPGRLKDRIDEAWQSIKSKLVRGLSIGFSELESARIKDTYSYHYMKWLWLELSAVTIPANQEASIVAIKSADVLVRRHTDRPPRQALPVVTINTPGAAGTRTGQSHMAKTIAERKQGFLAEKAAKVAKMNELMDAADGATLDAAGQEAFDTLQGEVAAIDKHLANLESLETINKAAAVPVAGASAEEASRSRGASVITLKDRLAPGIEFARYAMCLAASKGNTHVAHEIAKARFPDMTRIHQVLKAAVEAGTTTDPTWAAPLVPYQQYAGDFIEFLRPMTILGKFGAAGIPALRAVPFNVQIKGQTSGGAGYWVGQGRAKPLTNFDFTNVSLRWAKVANISVITEELARFSSPSAEMLVRDGLAGALIERLDIDFVDPNKALVADISPASITNGVTPIQGSGADAAAVRADVAAIMTPFIDASITPTNGVWIMSTTLALQLSLMRNALGQREFPDITMLGGRFEGLPVIASEYCVIPGSPSNHIVILVNASDIYLADDGQVVIDVSREASLEMSDAPTQRSNDAGSPPDVVTATSMVSLWQTNAIGIKAERFINWAKRRTAAAQYLENVKWSSAAV